MNKPIKRPNSLQEQMKIKKFDPIELRAWNSIYKDITFKNKKVCSKKIFEVCKDPPPKPKPQKKIDIKKVQVAKPFKKKKIKNPKVFIE